MMIRAYVFTISGFLFLFSLFIYDSYPDVKKSYEESRKNKLESFDAIINTSNGSYISSTTPIMITFDELIDPNTLKLRGTMITQNEVIEWLTFNNKDNILIINPQNAWPTGLGLTLQIECNNIKASQVYNLNLTYNIINKSCCGGKNNICEVNL
jgi:hypothetical protein